MYTLYSIVTALGMILLAPYFLVRGLMTGKYLDHVPERMGWRFPSELGAPVSANQSGTVWIHAVSVGEVLAALPLAKCIKERYPARRLVISTTTKTGQALVRERNVADAVFYFPLDWRGPVRRVLKAVRPSVVIVVETEIWPNFLRVMRGAGVPVIFVNGRVSERSFRGYQRAFSYSGGMLRGFLRRVLNDATIFLMQSDRDAARLLEMGAAKDRVVVAGNLKYDIGMPAPNAFSDWLSEALAQSSRRPVIVAGSVVADEETIVIEAFVQTRKRVPNALLVLAPRKPERFGVAAKIAADSGVKIARRSEIFASGNRNLPFDRATDILLLDSVGELARTYDLADVVFIGGSLVPIGGHNILEPAAFGKVPIFGPSMENFRDMAQSFLDASAALQVADAASLAVAWVELLGAPEKSRQMGAAAARLVERNRGATSRAVGHIVKVLETPRSAL